MKKLLFPLFLAIAAHAGAGVIDSLEKALAGLRDTARLATIHRLSFEIKMKGEPEKAMKLSLEGLAIAEKAGHLYGQAQNLGDLGLIYTDLGDFDKAMEVDMRAVEIYNKIGNKANLPAVYGNMANILFVRGDYASALDYQLNALKFEEETGKQTSGAFGNAGNIYFQIRNYEKALEFYEKSLKIALEKGPERSLGNCYNNLGNVAFAQKDYKKALDYHQRSLKIKEKIGSPGSTASAYINIGEVNLRTGEYDKAAACFEKARELYAQSANKHGHAFSYIQTGKVETMRGNLHNAETCLAKALIMANAVGDRNMVGAAYQALADLFEKKKEFRQAMIYFRRYSEIKDTLFDNESNKNLASMQARYDSEKKDNEIRLLNKDKEQQAALAEAESTRNRYILISVLSGLVVALGLALLAFRSYRQKQKANGLLEQRNRQVVDSLTYASRIQEAILPSYEQVKECFPRSFIFYRPKDIVSGDFYWMAEKGGVIIIAVADCTGHGVPGAFMSMIGNTLLNEIVNERNIVDPGMVLHELNTGVMHSLHQDKGSSQHDGMDISVCVIDRQKLQAGFAGANHNMGIGGPEGVRVITGDIFSIGGTFGRAGTSFRTQPLVLAAGTMLYMYTDGFIDQFGGPKNEKYNSQRFERLLSEINKLDIQDQEARINEEFRSWKGDNRQLDDVCIVGVRL